MSPDLSPETANFGQGHFRVSFPEYIPVFLEEHEVGSQRRLRLVRVDVSLGLLGGEVMLFLLLLMFFCTEGFIG